MTVVSATDVPEPATEPPAGVDRRLILAGAACAAATVGILFNSFFVELRVVTGDVAGNAAAGDDQLYAYTTVGALVAALLVLRLFPRRGWAWLLGAGSVLALPLPISMLDRELLSGIPADVLSVMLAASTHLVLLGVLGAAAWVRTARPGAAAGLAGTAAVLPLVGTVVLVMFFFGLDTGTIETLIIVFGLLGWLGAVGAVMVATAAATAATAGRVPRPGWRVTSCAILAAFLPLLPVWVEQGDLTRLLGTPPEHYLLVTGLAIAVPGMTLALVAGLRVGAAALVAAPVGVALLAAGSGVAVSQSPAIVIPAVLLGVVVGWLIGTGRWRVWFAVGGLAVCAVALLVAPDDVHWSRLSGGAATLTIVLLGLGIAAVVAAMASTTTLLADASLIPAAFGSLVVAVQGGAGLLTGYLIVPDQGGGVGPATIGVVLLVALVAVAAIGAWQLWRRRTDDAPAPEGEAVVHQLPPEDPR